MLAGCGLPVDLDAGQRLVAAAAALARGALGRPIRLGVERRGEYLATSIIALAGGEEESLRGPGAAVRVPAISVIEPTACVVQAAAQTLRGRLEWAPGGSGVCICWPVS
jgi:hypothetical protein